MGTVTIDNSLGNGRIIGCATLPEEATITAGAPTSTTNFDVLTQSVQYYTSNSTINFTLNIRGDATNTFNSISTVGQSHTIVLLVTNGGTAYYPTAIQIDGVAQTVKWQGGTAPTSGNANSIDAWSYTILKTASTPTYVVLASSSKYA